VEREQRPAETLSPQGVTLDEMKSTEIFGLGLRERAQQAERHGTSCHQHCVDLCMVIVLLLSHYHGA